MPRNPRGRATGRPRKLRPLPEPGSAKLTVADETMLPPEPPGLGVVGRKAWRDALGLVVAAGCTDALTLARCADLATLTERAATAGRIIRRRGLVVSGSTGSPVANPAALIERDSLARVDALRRGILEVVADHGRGADDDVEAYLRRVGYFDGRSS
jgi:hypothetical protein